CARDRYLDWLLSDSLDVW
nr:immunoglobulin heavy chain junction region [Macaca mulatta]